MKALLMALALAASLGAADRYLAASGDDASDGATPASAWRSLERASRAELQPGDRLLLRGGDRFAGTLVLARSGTAKRPISVASWGEGRATIAPPPGSHAIRVSDAGGLEIRDLDLVGPGVEAADTGSGLFLWAHAADCGGIVVRGLRCSGFPARGIELWADAAKAGFHDLRFEDCECTGNGEGGMGSWGPCAPGAYAFRKVVVRACAFHGNRGRPAKRDNHSGNGIILADCQDALIEHCSAWGNGELCNSPVGGPVGIWLCESDRSVIRGCLSYRNRTGAGIPDGGGFDLDGGCTGCVIEDCLSWRNDGAGYLVCQYRGARPFRGNVVRNCISVGDGRARNNGGIFLWCEEPGSVHDTLVAHNTVVMDGGTSHPAAVRLAAAGDGLHLRDNLLLALAGADLLREAGTPGVDFGGDVWWSADGPRFVAGTATVATPAGTRFADPGLSLGALPDSIDAAWCGRLASRLVSDAALPAAWVATLRAAGCDPAMPSGIGARPLPRYGR